MTLRDAWQGPISIIYLIVDRMGGAARGCDQANGHSIAHSGHNLCDRFLYLLHYGLSVELSAGLTQHREACCVNVKA